MNSISWQWGGGARECFISPITVIPTWSESKSGSDATALCSLLNCLNAKARRSRGHGLPQWPSGNRGHRESVASAEYGGPLTLLKTYLFPQRAATCQHLQPFISIDFLFFPSYIFPVRSFAFLSFILWLSAHRRSHTAASDIIGGTLVRLVQLRMLSLKIELRVYPAISLQRSLLIGIGILRECRW